jgi:hypothetical protein
LRRLTIRPLLPRLKTLARSNAFGSLDKCEADLEADLQAFNAHPL